MPFRPEMRSVQKCQKIEIFQRKISWFLSKNRRLLMCDFLGQIKPETIVFFFFYILFFGIYFSPEKRSCYKVENFRNFPTILFKK